LLPLSLFRAQTSLEVASSPLPVRGGSAYPATAFGDGSITVSAPLISVPGGPPRFCKALFFFLGYFLLFPPHAFLVPEADRVATASVVLVSVSLSLPCRAVVQIPPYYSLRPFGPVPFGKLFVFPRCPPSPSPLFPVPRIVRVWI